MLTARTLISRTPVRTGPVRAVLVDYQVSDGDAPEGCSVISSRGRCNEPGKMRIIGCLHEHMSPPVEICDDCVRLIEVRDCMKCYESTRPHPSLS